MPTKKLFFRVIRAFAYTGGVYWTIIAFEDISRRVSKMFSVPIESQIIDRMDINFDEKKEFEKLYNKGEVLQDKDYRVLKLKQLLMEEELRRICVEKGLDQSFLEKLRIKKVDGDSINIGKIVEDGLIIEKKKIDNSLENVLKKITKEDDFLKENTKVKIDDNFLKNISKDIKPEDGFDSFLKKL